MPAWFSLPERSSTRSKCATVILAWSLGLTTAPLHGQPPFPTYPTYASLLPVSPGAGPSSLHGFANPALLNYAAGNQTLFTWSQAGVGRPDQWGLFSAFHRLGFGYIERDLPGKNRRDYRLSLATGDRRVGAGLSYGWAGGNTTGAKKTYSLGALVRPNPHLSLGLVLTTTTTLKRPETSVDLAIRPFGTPRLTLFADGARSKGTSFWSGGLALGLADGIGLNLRYFDFDAISIGLDLDLGDTGVSSHTSYDRKHERRAHSTYALRLGTGPTPSAIAQRLAPKKQYLKIDLLGSVPHQRPLLFDRGHTLVGLLNLIRRAEADPQIAGLALKLSGARLSPATAWEIRQALQRFKDSGKHIIAYIDQTRLRSYYFASIADRIVQDPAGLLALEGLVGGGTYFKGTLKKLGIGFEEWRFFKYKSLFEFLTREQMSAADRQQTQALLDDFYHHMRGAISQSRQLAPKFIDRILDENPVLLPAEAQQKDLVDHLGRWDQIETFAEELEGAAVHLRPALAYAPPQEQTWGERPQIALLYALGACAMDSGIGARRFVQLVDRLADDPYIEAVVLRVNSPGGEAFAADLMAAALQRLAQKKPLIVSQGYIAASGGYALSMYGETVFTTPLTITGSIGVIAGWAYNEGFKEKLGASTDRVQVGRHADLIFGMTLPFVGLRLPDRNLDAAEKTQMEHLIRAQYDRFAGQVAQGRGLATTALDTLAQGRVWSGAAAQQRGLADQLGGLVDAIDLAKERAGLPPDQVVQVVQVPSPTLFDRSALVPPLLGVKVRQDPIIEQLRFRLGHNGQALMMLPLDIYGSLAPDQP